MAQFQRFGKRVHIHRDKHVFDDSAQSQTETDFLFCLHGLTAVEAGKLHEYLMGEIDNFICVVTDPPEPKSNALNGAT